MNGSTENTAFGASESPEPRETAMSLGTAREMLPLVKHVVADILHQQAILTRLQPEQSLLDEQRVKVPLVQEHGAEHRLLGLEVVRRDGDALNGAHGDPSLSSGEAPAHRATPQAATVL
jgi:hypothetical protein